MIKFSCKNCGQKLNVEDKYSSKRVKCPKCGSVGVVPDISNKISFRCENCGQKIKVSKSYTGKKGKCPKCNNMVIIPAQEPSPAGPRLKRKTVLERKEYNSTMTTGAEIVS